MKKQKNETLEQFNQRKSEKLALAKQKRALSLNKKKSPTARRGRNNLGVYIPYVLLNISEFPTKLSHGRKSRNPQFAINQGLINRAHNARKDGGYHKINARLDS